MQFKFGQGVMDMIPLEDTMYQLSLPPSHQKAHAILPIKIYAWSCKNDTGTPPHPPKAIRMDADVITFKAFPVSMVSPLDQGFMEQNSIQNLVQGSGFRSMKEVQKELDRLFPPQEIAVPYAKLVEPFKLVDCMDLYAQQIYLTWHARFMGLDDPFNLAFFHFRIPLAARFFVKVTDVCEGYLDKKYMTGADTTIRLEQSETGKKLIDGHKADLEKQRELSERWNESTESFRDE